MVIVSVSGACGRAGKTAAAVANVTRPLAEWAPDLLSRLGAPSPNEDLARA